MSFKLEQILDAAHSGPAGPWPTRRDIGTIVLVSRGRDLPDAPSSVVDFDPTVSLVRSFGGVNDSLGA